MMGIETASFGFPAVLSCSRRLVFIEHGIQRKMFHIMRITFSFEIGSKDVGTDSGSC